MVTANMNSGRMIHDASSNDASGHLDGLDYSNTIVNFTPSEILHHSQLLNIKKMDGSYMHARDLHVYQQADGSLITSGNLQSQQSSLPLLTPIKYVEYQAITEDQIIMNEDSDKSDCESGEHELHKTPSKLPHKKRIAKKLNSTAQSFGQQDQFSIIMPAEESQQRNIRPINVSYSHFHLWKRFQQISFSTSSNATFAELESLINWNSSFTSRTTMSRCKRR